jgi:hypothetical protein
MRGSVISSKFSGLPSEVEAALLAGRRNLLPAGQTIVQVEDVVIHLFAEHELPVETRRGRRCRDEQLVRGRRLAARRDRRSRERRPTPSAAADFRNDLRVVGGKRRRVGYRTHPSSSLPARALRTIPIRTGEGSARVALFQTEAG